MATRSALAHLLATPENRAALAALQDVLHALTAGHGARLPGPLLLHGPSGCGKTYLVDALLAELCRAGFDVCRMSANDFADRADLTDTRAADLLVIEDLQHLPTRFVEMVLTIFDERDRNGAPMIFTASQGPGRLQHRGAALPRRLTNRLASGLVVALEPMQKASRRRLLENLAQEARLHATPDILDWFAEHLVGGGRQLEGAVRQWQALERLQKRPLCLDDLRGHFRSQVEAAGLSVERIAEHVCASFQVAPKQVASARRSRELLLPRQVSMYLARQLTTLSLAKIGKYFGCRDHKTVQHACKKVESAMKSDAHLSGAVRQLRSELS